MRAVMIAVALLLGVVQSAAAADPPQWKTGNWFGDIRSNEGSCMAVYADSGDYSFNLVVYPSGSRIRDSSLVYLYFTDDGDDIDDDQGFSAFLNEKSPVTFTMGDAFRAQTDIVQALVHSFEFGLPRTALDAVGKGGPLTIQLPKGKHYTMKLPPSQPAMARFTKCFAGN
jgi:hypothetical protein